MYWYDYCKGAVRLFSLSSILVMGGSREKGEKVGEIKSREACLMKLRMNDFVNG